MINLREDGKLSTRSRLRQKKKAISFMSFLLVRVEYSRIQPRISVFSSPLGYEDKKEPSKSRFRVYMMYMRFGRISQTLAP